jgi:phenylacetate-CoA ligase
MNRGIGFARDLFWALRHPESADRDALEGFQLRRLRALVQHAHDHVPFYRRHFAKARFDPRQLRSLADLERIPTVEKDELRLAGPDCVADNVDRSGLIARHTSGTTGIPFEVLRTRDEVKLLTVIALRRLHRHGVRFRDRRTVVKSPEPGMPGMPGTLAPQPLHARLGWNPRWGADATRSRREIVGHLRELRPDVISGWAQALADVAAVLTDEDREHIRPRLIAPGGEILSVRARALIGASFRVPIVDRYGADEMMQMADECRTGRSFHLIESSGLLEVLTQQGRAALPGETGEFVITSFFSWSMPFIRYRMADVVTAGEPRCACGARLRTIQRIEGRTIDCFTLRDGRRVHPRGLDVPLLADVGWLHKYQFVQESRESVRLRMIPLDGSPPSAETVADLERRVRSAVPLPLEVRCEVVERIEHRPGGKFRTFVPLEAPALAAG